MSVTLDGRKLTGPVWLSWRVPVQLMPERQPVFPLPVALPPWRLPKDASACLGPGPGIQVNDPNVRRVAQHILQQASSVQDVVFGAQAVLQELNANKKTFQHRPYAPDAAGFLRGAPGECDANANLFAALLRACGVPCRPIGGLARGMGQDLHRQCEYFVPGHGWVHIEPQHAGTVSTPRDGMVQIHNHDAGGSLGSPFRQRMDEPSFVNEVDPHGFPVPPAARSLRLTFGLQVDGPFPGVQAHACG